MKQTGYFILMLLAVLLMLSACSTNKKIEEPVIPPPTPLELALAAADSASTAFTDKNYLDALKYFNAAREFYTQAEPTATPADSIDVNIEKTQLNIALTYMNMANENNQLSMFEDALNQYQSAVDIYKSLVPLTIPAAERDTDVAILYRNMALTAQNAGLYERALGYYDTVLTYEPGSEEILNIKYHILKDNIKDNTRAYQVLKDYAEASQDYKAWLILAIAYKDNGDNATAGTYYDKALELGKNADVYTKVADFYRGIGNYQKSNTVLEQFVASGPDNTYLALAYRVMAGNYDKLKNTAKKIEFYDKSLTIEPNADVALILANHYNQNKSWDQVIKYASKVISLDTAKTAAFLLRGNAYYMKKKYPEAKADLTRIQNDANYGKSASDLLKKIK
jgi:tetratricopeptide (TPR) repeat protein